jgi:hypothetical protein
MTNDHQLQKLASGLVEREVYYCVSSLIGTLNTLAGTCDTQGELDYDDLMNLMVRDDWESPARYFISQEADFVDLEAIADEFGYWSDVLAESGVRDEVAETTDWVCDDCLQFLVNGTLPPDSTPARDAEITDGCLSDAAPTDEEQEFSINSCDHCGTPLAGRRHGMCDGSMSDDLQARINATENPERTEDTIREKVAALVEAESDGWQKVCDDNRLDPEQREAYEHWIVSGWLARKLSERGELTGEVCGLTIWGRCTTGQSISMDGVIEEITAEIYKDELTKGVEDGTA